MLQSNVTTMLQLETLIFTNKNPKCYKLQKLLRVEVAKGNTSLSNAELTLRRLLVDIMYPLMRAACLAGGDNSHRPAGAG